MADGGGEWGVVSHRFTDLVTLLKVKISLETNLLNEATIPSHGDVEPGIARSIAAAHRLTSAAKDLRSALSVYAHRVHVPRPKVAVVAEAQGTNAQGLVRRYNSRIEEAVVQLIAGTATEELLVAAFPSLTVAEAGRLIRGHRGRQSTGMPRDAHSGSSTAEAQAVSDRPSSEL